MTEHFTSEEAVALASTIVEDDDYEFNLVNAAINAKQKEWEALGAVAIELPDYHEAAMGCGLEDRRWHPLHRR